MTLYAITLLDHWQWGNRSTQKSGWSQLYINTWC